jgi:hypothetical protein
MMASKRRQRRKSCEGKAKHATEAAAVIQIQRSGERGLNPYKCKHCSGWHVGHPPAHVRQGMAARRQAAAV